MELCDFCEGFFHVEQSVEMQLPNICLCQRLCLRKSVTCIARITTETGEEVFKSAYKNRKEFGNATTHAEKLMIWDFACLNAIRSSKDARIMTLYLTYQPCHFSGGHSRPSSISCTQELVRFKERELEKHNVSLIVKVAYIYRAFWDPGNSDRKYWKMIENAKLGIRLLRQHGIALEAFEESDWLLIRTFCSDDAQKRIQSIESFKQNHRRECDSFNQNFLKSFS